ncbi:MAG: methyltransferase domain-containing protein [Solirubrobacteraceae bacterium]|nr:methyltransferase domain-containing protein [Solirubrobacteraceae bacterium]
MTAPPTAEEIRDVNTRYHDVAAKEYDAKWGIDFGDTGTSQVRMKLEKALGGIPATPFANALEIGSGTGYFTLNLMLQGIIEQATCTDISPGMLESLADNAERLGLGDRVTTEVADAEALPFEDESFDLVLGHAILHHIPDLAQAFREFKRVLKPGGQLVFAGEPSRTGDRIANVPKGFAQRVAPAWRTVFRAKAADLDAPLIAEPDHSLESVVDVWAFVPSDLAGFAESAGFADVDIIGEELLANWFGWTNRTLEATADPSTIPWPWRQYAFRGYLFWQQVDQRFLEGRLPADIFYNLMVTATKPA